MDNSSQPQDSLSADVIIVGVSREGKPLMEPLGPLQINLNDPVEDLLEDVKWRITQRDEDDKFKSKYVTQACKEAHSLIATKQNVAPKVDFNTTIHAFINNKKKKHMGMVDLDHHDWQRFKRVVDLTHDVDDLRKTKNEVHIMLCPNDKGHPASTSSADTAVVSPSRPTLANYVRVGTIQSTSISSTRFRGLRNNKLAVGDIPVRYVILAKVDEASPTTAADNLRIVSVWEVHNTLFGDVEKYESTNYEDVTTKGTGFFTEFKNKINGDKTQLGSVVNGEHQRQLDVAAGLITEKASDKQKYARIMPRMTLNRLDLTSFGNADRCIFADGVDGHAAIRVVYHLNRLNESQAEVSKERYPQSMQMSFAPSASVEDLEDKLFDGYKDEAAAINQPVDFHREDPWDCRWYIMPHDPGQADERKAMFQVPAKKNPLATYVRDAKDQNGKLHLYLECHVHYHEGDEEETESPGDGLNDLPLWHYT